jgi:hypothetical protein
MNDKVAQTPTRSIRPLAIWSWGFSGVLVAVGLWLVLTEPTVAGSNARMLGWILLGYSIVRLLFAYLMNLSRGMSWRR